MSSYQIGRKKGYVLSLIAAALGVGLLMDTFLGPFTHPCYQGQILFSYRKTRNSHTYLSQYVDSLERIRADYSCFVAFRLTNV